MPKRWFRVYADGPASILTNRKIQQLPPKLFKWVVNLWAIASQHEEGTLPPLDDIAWLCHEPAEEVSSVVAELVALRFIDEIDGAFVIHDWAKHQHEAGAGASTERVRRFRRRAKTLQKAYAAQEVQTENGPVLLAMPREERRGFDARDARKGEERRGFDARDARKGEETDFSARIEALEAAHPRRGEIYIAQQYFADFCMDPRELDRAGVEDADGLMALIEQRHAERLERDPAWAKRGEDCRVPFLSRWIAKRGYLDPLPEPVETSVIAPELLAEWAEKAAKEGK